MYGSVKVFRCSRKHDGLMKLNELLCNLLKFIWDIFMWRQSTSSRREKYITENKVPKNLIQHIIVIIVVIVKTKTRANCTKIAKKFDSVYCKCLHELAVHSVAFTYYVTTKLIQNR